MTTDVPYVKVRCRVCRLEFELPADHEDVAHPWPGPICTWCETEERDSSEDTIAEDEWETG